jgi:hypothetical protein
MCIVNTSRGRERRRVRGTWWCCGRGLVTTREQRDEATGTRLVGAGWVDIVDICASSTATVVSSPDRSFRSGADRRNASHVPRRSVRSRYQRGSRFRRRCTGSGVHGWLPGVWRRHPIQWAGRRQDRRSANDSVWADRRNDRCAHARNRSNVILVAARGLLGFSAFQGWIVGSRVQSGLPA